MWFWWFLFACDLLIPILMIVFGRMMWKHPPKKINGIVGYRTPASMKNTDTWKFAHEYCGRLWWKMGWVLFVPSAAVHVPFYRGSEAVIGTVSGILCAVQCVILIVSIFPTERALRRNFTREGIRKEEK